MPINLTQEFTFETDTIDNVAIALRAMMPILFRERLYVRAADPVDDEWPSETAAWFLSRPDDGADRPPETGASLMSRFGRFFRRENDTSSALHWPVCTLSSTVYHGEDQIALTAEDAVNETLRRVRQEDVRNLARHCGGPRGPFSRADGGVHPGYRMHWSTQHGDWLIVSLCHIYYSK